MVEDVLPPQVSEAAMALSATQQIDLHMQGQAQGSKKELDEEDIKRKIAAIQQEIQMVSTSCLKCSKTSFNKISRKSKVFPQFSQATASNFCVNILLSFFKMILSIPRRLARKVCTNHVFSVCYEIEKIFAGSGAEASRRSDAHGQSPRPRPLRASPLWRAVEQRCGRTADTVPGHRRHQKDSAAETQSARWITGLKNKINHGEK